jgi:hypothetical protein
MGRAAQLLAGAYVVAVAVLVAVSFREPGQGFSVTEGVAFVLTLPVLLAALPIVYLVGAAAWSITDAGDGGPMWPVTVVFVLMFVGVAVANLWLFRRLLRRLVRVRT